MPGVTFEIQGLHSSGVWHPLYNGYRTERYAKAVMGAILEQDPPECKEYEDFRVAPEGTQLDPPPNRRRTAQDRPGLAPEGFDASRVVRTPLLTYNLKTTKAVCAECGTPLSKREAESDGRFFYCQSCHQGIPRRN